MSEGVFGNGAGAGTGAGTTSVACDMTGASLVEQAPANGQYDCTIVNAEIHEGKQKPDEPHTQSLYAKVQIQLDTEPSRGRQVFDMLLIRLKDGSRVGTVSAYARNYTQPFILGQLFALFGLPVNSLNVGPIEELKGKQFRGVFRAEIDQGEPRLKLRKVIGAPTGKGFAVTVKATTATVEDFA